MEPELRRALSGLRRAAFLVIAAALVTAVGIAVANVRGWRALVISRALRTNNPPTIISPPSTFSPTLPAGFTATVFATGFVTPRWLAVAPNGDVFVADSGTGEIVVLNARDASSSQPAKAIFANNLRLPYGIAFDGEYVYVATIGAVTRYKFDERSSLRVGDGERIIELPDTKSQVHWARSIALDSTRRRLFVSMGSTSNVSVESDPRHAAVLMSELDGTKLRTFATGLRHATGLAVNPTTGELWATVNERDNLGDDTPADFLTGIVDSGFYGWPYSYMGGRVDNRVPARPDLVQRALTPTLLLGAHVAPMQFLFYTGKQFPERYLNGAFVAEHGSWNRRSRAGYQVVFVPFQDGQPAGEPIAFLTGLVPNPSSESVYGRPVGIAMLNDGSLLVSDDGAKVIWRVTCDQCR